MTQCRIQLVSLWLAGSGVKANFGLTTDNQVAVALPVNIKEIFKFFFKVSQNELNFTVILLEKKTVNGKRDIFMISGNEKSEMQFDEFKKYHAIWCRIMMENDIGILSLLLEQIIAHVEEKTNFSLLLT